MQLSIKKISIVDIENSSNVKELVEAYNAESQMQGLPPAAPRFDMYRQFEKVGAYHVFGAYLDTTMIGFITFLSSIIPHYGIKLATTESFFVLKEYRKTGAGLKLRSAAVKYAKEIHAEGILISAPLGSDLAELLSRDVNYIETNRVFFRKFLNEQHSKNE